jgi:phage terminase small subunit
MTDDISDTEKTMTPRQRRFVDEYLIDLNASQAFLRAGYSATHARRSAWRLMHIPAVRAAIEDGQQALAAASRVSAERVIAEYVRVAFASVQDYLDIGEDGRVRLDITKAPSGYLAAIADFRFEEEESPQGGRVTRLRIKLANKLHALDSLSRHLGLFTARPAARAAETGSGGEDGRDLAAELREAQERLANWHNSLPEES